MDDIQKKEEIKNRIYDYLKDGMFKKDAAVMAGISEATFYRWIEEDESFKSRVEASILEYKHTLIKNINTCAAENGKLALEILMRRFPNDWNGNSKTDKEEEEGRSTKQVAEMLQEILHKDHEEKHAETINVLPNGDSSINSQIEAITPKNDKFMP